jgi:hypothetical protein
MHYRFAPALLSVLSAVALQAQVSVPRAGLVRFSDGMVRAVVGLPGNLVVDQKPLFAADQIAFSGLAGLTAYQGHIQLFNSDQQIIGEYVSNDLAPVLNVTAGLDSAVAWLPSTQTLVYWDGKALVAVDASLTSLPGSVRSIVKANPNQATLFMELPDKAVMEATVSLETGGLVSLVPKPGLTGTVYRTSGGFLFWNGSDLKFESDSGVVQKVLASSEPLIIERMSSNWLHILSPRAKRSSALYLEAKQLHLSAIPSAEVGQ